MLHDDKNDARDFESWWYDYRIKNSITDRPSIRTVAEAAWRDAYQKMPALSSHESYVQSIGGSKEP